jgi:peroxiredoxin
MGLMRWIMGMLLLLVVLGGCTKEKPAPRSIGEGQPAVDITLRDLAGQEVKLSDLRGKVVLLNFWATWCPPCRAEIPSMAKLNQLMAGKPYQMLAVSIDDQGKPAVETFFQQQGVTLPTYLDPEQKIAKVYGVTGVPETFIIDKQGVIQKKVIGGMDWSSPEVVSYLEGLARP